jgi:predicted RNase H-like HicB family nuclease
MGTVLEWTQSMGNEIVFNLNGYYRKDEAATGCVSYCPSLNIFSHGKDADEARDHLWKAVRLYLETSLKNINTLEKVMKSVGFEPEQEFVRVGEKEFDTAFDMAIPFPLHRSARAMTDEND